MDKRLNIAFLWHMHQPLYKDSITGEFILPWVLFHGTKDYYDMVTILEEFPELHQTFNLVPSLIDQLQEYASGKASDKYRNISLKRAADITVEDKLFMLQFFFQANMDTMIRPLPRYRELYLKRGSSNDINDIRQALRYLREQDYLDLQVLFNLVWIDPEIRRNDKALDQLYKKGANYTESEKTILLDKQIEIIRKILPKYVELQNRGIIEVSTTPYFHPIMPLLCDSFAARESMPDVLLPKERFRHPEDALTQLRNGIALYKEIFGVRPKGIWPSEGSVSMDILPLVKGEGIEWLATDEEILTNSLKRGIRRDGMGNCLDTFLYKPYAIDVSGSDISLVFRDHVLSDLIGFDYAKMDSDAAADDMVSRLVRIHNTMEAPQEHIVSIILDGENAWEHFRNDGRDFLVALYKRLSGHPKLKCVTVNEFLAGQPRRERLPWLYPGSWISHNFKIWIGHIEDNTAWDYISEARAALVSYQEAIKSTPQFKDKAAAIEAAWWEIYAAEGSDWFWWYGEEHTSMTDEIFDLLFRNHIKRIYNLIGMEYPDHLDSPISSEAKGYRPPVVPTAYIKPVIDGEVTNYFEWLASGRLERVSFGSAMHSELQAKGLIEVILYGFSQDTLFFRLDYLSSNMSYDKEWHFSITFSYPKPVKIEASIKGQSSKAVILEKVPDDKWVESGRLESIAANTIVELGIPFKTLGIKKGDEVKLFITIESHDKGFERWPVKGYLIFEIPLEDIEQQNWMV